MSSTALQAVFLALVALLLPAALVRWSRTPETHPDHEARGDTVRLLALVLIGQVGSLIRERFPFGAVGFWICTVALLPIAGIALFLIRRLLMAYRRSHSALALDSQHDTSVDPPEDA